MSGDLSEWHFLRPQWLLALPLGLALIGLCWHYLAPRSNWDRLCDAHLLRYLTVGQNRPGGRRPLGALLVGYLLAVVAAAGPSWEQQPQPAYRTAQGRVLVYDLSSSMDSIDLAPSRLTRARFKLTDLIAAGQGRQQGLVVFAGDAFVVAPLTDDIETLHNLIPSLTTASVPVQGSRADLGLKLAAELLDNAGYTHGEVILIADGVSADSAAVAADLARRDYPVSVLAVGSGQGAPIPLADGGLLKDAAGNIVLAGVRFAELQQVAASGQGVYSQIQVDDRDIRVLNSAAAGPAVAARATDDDPFADALWLDRGAWLLLPLLLLASTGFRRGWLLVLVLATPSLMPTRAIAFDWADLWLRPEQQAAQALDREDFTTLSTSPLPGWQGAGHYRQNHYAQAVEAFARQPGARGWYNRGNALAHSGALEAALEAYNQALELDAEFDDARFNRELVWQLLEQAAQSGQADGDPSQQGDDDQAGQQQTGQQAGDDQAGQQQTGQQADDDQAGQQQAGQQADDDQAGQQQAGQQADDDQAGQQTGDDQAGQQQAGQQADDDQAEQPEDTADQAQSAAVADDQAPADPADDDAERATASSADPDQTDEQQLTAQQYQALQYWLRQIPDDPGGLLRRKFAHQYRQRPQQKEAQKW